MAWSSAPVMYWAVRTTLCSGLRLDALELLHFSSDDVNGSLFGPIQLLCFADVEEEFFLILAPHCQVFDLLPIGCLIVVGDQGYQICVVSKLNDGGEVVQYWGEQGVQDGTKHAPLKERPC